MHWLNIPVIVPPSSPGGGGPTPTNQTMTPSSTPVFRTSTNCPIPNEWLLGAALVGLVAGYLIWGSH